MRDKNQVQRFITIDFMRGLGVLLMIIFHGIFDLNFFQLVKIPFLDDLYWILFGRFILILFLVCVGMSLALVHKRGINWKSFRKRCFKIGAWALIITIVTYVVFPKNFIFFGILHCIAISSLIGVLFVNRPRLSLFLCFVLVIPDFIFQPTLIPMEEWLGVTSIDYVPLYPWVGFVLLGIFLESINVHRAPIIRHILITPFEIMGKHSLKIYLLHQPILFGFCFSLYRLTAPS